MPKSAILVALAALAFTVAVPAAAHPGHSPVDVRQARQHVRIVDGVRSGMLTRPEARALAAEQAAIRAQARRDRADGVLTAREHAALMRALDHASRHIVRETRDRQRRPLGPRW